MMRIGGLLLVCALLAGCGCIDPAPNSENTCWGPGGAASITASRVAFVAE